jgi:hypothetical protein
MVAVGPRLPNHAWIGEGQNRPRLISSRGLSLFLLAASGPADASINYNACKSNTGTTAFRPGGGKVQPGIAVKGGVSQSGSIQPHKGSNSQTCNERRRPSRAQNASRCAGALH